MPYDPKKRRGDSHGRGGGLPPGLRPGNRPSPPGQKDVTPRPTEPFVDKDEVPMTKFGDWKNDKSWRPPGFQKLPKEERIEIRRAAMQRRRKRFQQFKRA